MSLLMPERLYQLLPAVYRLRDAGQGEPLRALLAIIEGELERVEADTAGLYDNWFIETCDEWVVPYIGELLGVRPIRAIESAGVSARAYVANTMAYRRRKGTAVVLEQLARDTTGWPARVVEFFTRLATAQHLNHVRPVPPATPGIRDAARAELAGFARGAFDPFSHTPDVRRAASRGGRHNIPNIGLFLWRLRSYAVGAGVPGDADADFASARFGGGWWSVHPAGCDSPLFNRARTETTITHLAEEENVPAPLRGLAMDAELERLRQGVKQPEPRFMIESDPVLRVWVRQAAEMAPVEVRRQDMYFCEIPDAVELALPLPRAMAFDPERGRLAFTRGLDVREVWVQSSYGFSGDLGGGPYERGAAVRAANQAVSIDISAAGASVGFFDPAVWQAGVSHLLPDDGSGTLFPSLREAVAAWNLQAPGRTGVIVLMDSLSDDAGAGGSPPLPLEIDIGERSRLLIVAGEWPAEPIPGAPPGAVARLAGHFAAHQVRAHVVGDWVVRGTAAAGSVDGGTCFVNGVLIEGLLSVAPGNLGRLGLAHCSVIPGRGALYVAPGGNERLTVAIDRSICASVGVPTPIRSVAIRDSIIGDGEGSPALGVDAPESALALERSTFFGGVMGLTLSASDCIFGGAVEALRRQTGCVRFCYVAPGSKVPRRYRCQPELEGTTRIEALRAAAPQGEPPAAAREAAIRAEAAAAIRPLFTSRQYGDPGFGQLSLRCAQQIRSGAESGAEMGAFEFLKQPQREANLRDALDEYLRFGLEAGLHFVT
jgi:hypothetical protein